MKQIIVYIIMFGVLACNTPNQNVIRNTKDSSHAIKQMPELNNKTAYELFQRSIINGNQKAYNEVASTYLLNNKGDELFYYAFVMANRHDNPEAYYHIFDILFDFEKNKEKKLDDRSRYFALYCLLKSYELGYESSKFRLKEIYGRTDFPQSKSYLDSFQKISAKH